MQTTYREETDAARHNATTCERITDHLNKVSDAEFQITMGDDCIRVTVDDRVPYEAGDCIHAAVRNAFASWLAGMPKGVC